MAAVWRVLREEAATARAWCMAQARCARAARPSPAAALHALPRQTQRAQWLG
jgi:hypothetical protein